MALSCVVHLSALVATTEVPIKIERQAMALKATLLPPRDDLRPSIPEQPRPLERPSARSIPLPPAAEKAAAPSTATPAGLAAPLNLSELEGIELIGFVRLVLRVYVSSLGKLQRIEVVETVRIPADFLAAVMEQLSTVPMRAARTGDAPVASSFDLVIEGQPMAEIRTR